MIAGRLNEVIKIYKPQETINEYGEREMEYVYLYATRAKVEYNSGNRVNENNELVFVYNKNFQVRSYVPLLETYQIEWQGKRYRILTLEHRREYNDIVVNTELINE